MIKIHISRNCSLSQHYYYRDFALIQSGEIMRNPEFGHLLTGAINSIAAYEAKTAAAVEMEFGEKLGVAPSTIQRYKSGQLPPEPDMIEFLSEEAIRRGYLNREWLESFLRAARYPTPTPAHRALFPTHPQAAPDPHLPEPPGSHL